MTGYYMWAAGSSTSLGESATLNDTMVVGSFSPLTVGLESSDPVTVVRSRLSWYLTCLMQADSSGGYLDSGLWWADLNPLASVWVQTTGGLLQPDIYQYTGGVAGIVNTAPSSVNVARFPTGLSSADQQVVTWYGHSDSHGSRTIRPGTGAQAQALVGWNQSSDAASLVPPLFGPLWCIAVRMEVLFHSPNPLAPA